MAKMREKKKERKISIYLSYLKRHGIGEEESVEGELLYEEEGKPASSCINITISANETCEEKRSEEKESINVSVSETNWYSSGM